MGPPLGSPPCRRMGVASQRGPHGPSAGKRRIGRSVGEVVEAHVQVVGVRVDFELLRSDLVFSLECHLQYAVHTIHHAAVLAQEGSGRPDPLP